MKNILLILCFLTGANLTAQNLIQNGSFASGNSFWTIESPWTIKRTLAGAQNAAVMAMDNRTSFTEIRQTVPGLVRTKELRLTFDAYFQCASGTATLEVVIDTTTYLTLFASGSSVTLTHRDGSYGTNTPFSTGTWRGGLSAFIPWRSNDSIGILKFKAKTSQCGTINVGVDNISMVRNFTLPVTLTRFDAKKVGESVIIEWSTSQETNCSNFQVLEYDGKTEVKVAEETCGNSSQVKNYRVIVPAKEGTRYYRLRQVDADGTATTFSYKAVNDNTRYTWYNMYGYSYTEEPTVPGMYIRSDGTKIYVK